MVKLLHLQSQGSLQPARRVGQAWRVLVSDTASDQDYNADKPVTLLDKIQAWVFPRQQDEDNEPEVSFARGTPAEPIFVLATPHYSVYLQPGHLFIIPREAGAPRQMLQLPAGTVLPAGVHAGAAGKSVCVLLLSGQRLFKCTVPVQTAAVKPARIAVRTEELIPWHGAHEVQLLNAASGSFGTVLATSAGVVHIPPGVSSTRGVRCIALPGGWQLASAGGMHLLGGGHALAALLCGRTSSGVAEQQSAALHLPGDGEPSWLWENRLGKAGTASAEWQLPDQSWPAWDEHVAGEPASVQTWDEWTSALPGARRCRCGGRRTPQLQLTSAARSVVKFHATFAGALLVARDGTVRLVDMATGMPTTLSARRGTQDVAWLDESHALLVQQDGALALLSSSDAAHRAPALPNSAAQATAGMRCQLALHDTQAYPAVLAQCCVEHSSSATRIARLNEADQVLEFGLAAKLPRGSWDVQPGMAEACGREVADLHFCLQLGVLDSADIVPDVMRAGGWQAAAVLRGDARDDSPAWPAWLSADFDMQRHLKALARQYSSRPGALARACSEAYASWQLWAAQQPHSTAPTVPLADALSSFDSSAATALALAHQAGRVVPASPGANASIPVPAWLAMLQAGAMTPELACEAAKHVAWDSVAGMATLVLLRVPPPPALDSLCLVPSEAMRGQAGMQWVSSLPSTAIVPRALVQCVWLNAMATWLLGEHGSLPGVPLPWEAKSMRQASAQVQQALETQVVQLQPDVLWSLLVGCQELDSLSGVDDSDPACLCQAYCSGFEQALGAIMQQDTCTAWLRGALQVCQRAAGLGQVPYSKPMPAAAALCAAALRGLRSLIQQDCAKSAAWQVAMQLFQVLQDQEVAPQVAHDAAGLRQSLQQGDVVAKLAALGLLRQSELGRPQPWRMLHWRLWQTCWCGTCPLGQRWLGSSTASLPASAVETQWSSWRKLSHGYCSPRCHSLQRARHNRTRQRRCSGWMRCSQWSCSARGIWKH